MATLFFTIASIPVTSSKPFEPCDLSFIESVVKWNCEDECKYHCMWKTVNEFRQVSPKIHQFFGKWPQIRMFGVQEPASAIFSLINLVFLLKMLRRFLISVRPASPIYKFWLLYAITIKICGIWNPESSNFSDLTVSTTLHLRTRKMINTNYCRGLLLAFAATVIDVHSITLLTVNPEMYLFGILSKYLIANFLDIQLFETAHKTNQESHQIGCKPAGINTWVWSTIFHISDTKFTEKLDYCSAIAFVGSFFITSLARVTYGVLHKWLRSIFLFCALQYILSYVYFLIFIAGVQYHSHMNISVCIAPKLLHRIKGETQKPFHFLIRSSVAVSSRCFEFMQRIFSS
ncbi:hypothetical protein ACTXT7_006174 [Hymenolepis weldensis]